MKTLSIQKDRTLSVSEAAGNWWRSKNSFFSKIAEEEIVNKEVVLVHLILMGVIVGAAFVDTRPAISIFAMAASAVCVRLLNKEEHRKY